MAGLVPATHVPEADIVLHGFWKMGHRDKPGDDSCGKPSANID
jgi:hypothetical protein